MIATDEDALICDFAEVYNIYDIYGLPVEYAATLANGLRDDSRIKMLLGKMKVKPETLLLAYIADYSAINFYSKTKDAVSGRNKPPSFVEMLTGKVSDSKQTRQFDDGESFMEEWRRLNGN